MTHPGTTPDEIENIEADLALLLSGDGGSSEGSSEGSLARLRQLLPRLLECTESSAGPFADG